MKLRIPIQFYVFLTGITFCLLLFGLGEKLSFLTYSFGRIFSWTPGDVYDGSLNNWFLENNLQYFLRGGNILDFNQIFNSNFYWPEKNVLAMSDNWILITPIYGLLRLTLSPNFAFTGIIVLSLTANLMACFHLCRHATENKFYRLLASLLSAFSLTLLARISHAQLMPAFAGVLAIDSFINATDIRKLSTKGIDKKSGLLNEKEIVISFSGFINGFIWLLLQIFMGFYQGVFFIVATGCFIVVLILNRFAFKNTKFKVKKINLIDKFSKYYLSLKIFFFIVLIFLNGSLYWQYFTFTQNKEARSWGEVSTQIPKFWSIWFNNLSTPGNVSFPAPVQNINFDTYTGPFWEHSMFPGYTFMVLLFLGIWFGLKGSINKKNNNPKWKVMTLSNTALLMLFVSIGFGGANPILTIWLIFWKFIPGFSAIRAVSRIGIPIVLILSPLLAWTLTEIHNRLNKNAMFIILSLLFMLYLAGNVTKDIKRFDSTDYSSIKDNAINKIETIVKEKNCKIFYMSSPDTKDWMFDRAYPQLLAMWASVKLGIPTSSGYTGNNPSQGWNHMMNENQYKKWLSKMGVDSKAIADSCWINGDDII